MYATIKNNSGETRAIYHDAWYRLPQVQGCKEKLGYWESRFELFNWACNCAWFDPFTTLYIDAKTGEMLNYDALDQEYLDECAAANIEYMCMDDETVTVQWWSDEAQTTFEYSGLEFRPITPRVTHVYDTNGPVHAYMGDITADNDTAFKLALVALIDR